MSYTVEVRKGIPLAQHIINEGTTIITPPISENYFLFRIHMFADQYINAFPKFTTIGIGFALEEDWNTNLPYTCPAEQIADHIFKNRKYTVITRENIIEAIKELQTIIRKYKGEKDETIHG